jgi:hypothetical protein
MFSLTAKGSPKQSNSPVPAGPSKPRTERAQTAPSGSWSIIPGVLTVSWSYDATKNEVEVDVKVFWWTVDTLTGTLTEQKFEVSDKLDILGAITGDLTLDAYFKNPPTGRTTGLWVTGDLDVFGKTWKFSEKVLSW